MTSFLVIAAIFISVALGYRTKYNTGFFAIAFAYILGCFVLDLNASAIIRMWPINTFFVILSVSLFYNFALVNGTLEKVALQLLYICRGIPNFLPYIFFLIAVLIAALGAGYFSVMAFMVPIVLMLCEKMGMSKLVGAIAVNCGALSGANFMTSGSGVIFRGLIEGSGYNVGEAFGYSTMIFIVTMIFPFIFITFFLFITRKQASVSNVISIDKPEPLTYKQKQNLVLILLLMTMVLIFPLLKNFFPNINVIAKISSKVDVGLISIIMSIIALFLNLADEKQVIAKVPWNTLIMICGVGILISVAIEAGTINLLSHWIGTNIPTIAIPFVVAIVGAFMSFFSSTLGVVSPALFPLVPTLSATTGLPPAILFTCIVVGAQSSAISPFSSGGSMVLGAISNEEERTLMFPKLIFLAVPSSVLCATIYAFVISLIIK